MMHQSLKTGMRTWTDSGIELQRRLEAGDRVFDKCTARFSAVPTVCSWIAPDPGNLAFLRRGGPFRGRTSGPEVAAVEVAMGRKPSVILAAGRKPSGVCSGRLALTRNP